MQCKERWTSVEVQAQEASHAETAVIVRELGYLSAGQMMALREIILGMTRRRS